MLGNYGRSITQAVFTPPARVLAKAGVTPNMVTVAGTTLTVVVSISMLGTGHLWQGTVALAVILFADSLDGVLARLTGQASTFGAFFDSVLDRLGDGAVFGSLLAWTIFGMEEGATRTVCVIAGIVALVGVGAVPYARARAESVGVAATVGIAERTDRLVIALLAASAWDLGLPAWVFAAAICWVAFASLVTVVQRLLFTYRELGGASSRHSAS